MSDPLLQVEDLDVTFTTPASRGRPARAVRAVDGLTLDVRPGETVGLVGESGCGKSSAGWALLRLVAATGSVRFDGADVLGARGDELRALRRRLQIIFQDPFSSLNPRQRIGRALREALDVHGIGTRAEREATVVEMLERVGLDAAAAKRYPHEFSGGQRQRVGIARALTLRPRFIVCDEPTSALDVSTQAQIVTLLEELQAEHEIAYLFIAHDLAVVRHISDRVAVMYLGSIVELADAEDLYAEPRHPYTRALMQAAPIPDPGIEAGRAHVAVGGEPPDAADPPSGCRFRTRCPHATDLCARERPRLAAERGGRHAVACHHWQEIADGRAPQTRAAGPPAVGGDGRERR